MANFHLNRMARDLAVELSLDAAIELDEVIRGKLESTTALFHLAETLTRDVKGNPAGESSQTANLYRRAYAHVRSGQQQRPASDISDIVSKLVSVGKGTPLDADPEELQDLRDFCLGLNKELVSESYQRVPESPFTRTSKKDARLADLYRVQYA